MSLMRSVAVLVLIAGCNRSPSAPGTASSSNDATAPATSAASPSASVPQDDSPGARYQRREWVISRGNGASVFEAPGEWTCPPLPEKRPAGFTLILQKRGYEPSDWMYFGVSETSPCHFAWSMAWMEPPPATCRTIDAAVYDRLYAELRALSPHTIRSRRITEHVSPHRGGWGIHLRWDKVECSITDILDTEVDDRDRPRFEAVQELVRQVYERP